MAAQVPPAFLISFKETLIKSLSDFTLKFLYMTEGYDEVVYKNFCGI